MVPVHEVSFNGAMCNIMAPQWFCWLCRLQFDAGIVVFDVVFNILIHPCPADDGIGSQFGPADACAVLMQVMEEGLSKWSQYYNAGALEEYAFISCA